ncbi:NAD-dependent epimerase/dehydratase family protein [Acidovorax sp. NCPPB 3576]|uniref:NAD-dependent epimerase/dehydratase family protein n=1 Tax=Acidovorax sp. NCPPB 3576 TaxID=2940488 RepID=UPI00234A32A4|nr:NAD(P)-dependent oxidoreductase [Acidovorax sp. NCPPB 3576]WCM88962.1 NAD(P)-dependent oxidoreductase [Acidovorax sp. NCPPB 3576]
MHLFITGGTGFIGGHLLDALGKTAHRTTALCRRPEQAAQRPAERRTWICKPMDALEAADLRGVDVLVHLASTDVPPRPSEWQRLFYWNVDVLVRVLLAAQSGGVRRVVVAGTFAEYGRSFEKYDAMPCDAPLLPTYGYAASKAAAFQVASAFAIERGIEMCYLRIFSAFGEGQYAQNFWPALKKAALEGEDFPMTPGEQVRDYVDVEQVARAFLCAAESGGVQAGVPWVRNVGSGVPVSMKAFAEHWWSVWNAPGRLLVGALPYRPNELMRCVPRPGVDLLVG